MGLYLQKTRSKYSLYLHLQTSAHVLHSIHVYTAILYSFETNCIASDYKVTHENLNTTKEATISITGFNELRFSTSGSIIMLSFAK